MPRPDKRFVRYPRQGSSPEPEAEAAKPAPDDSQSFVKGRHMVVPRPSNPPQMQRDQAPPAPPTRRATPSELTTSKYDMRPTSGPMPNLQEEQPVDEEVAVVEPAAAAPEPAATEVVFDLRDSDRGFEGSYWKREAEEPAERDAL